MANTFTVTKVNQGVHQHLGMKEMFLVRGGITDQDSVADDVSAELTLTVPNVALGDHCISIAFDVSLADANASISVHPYVSAADTVTLKLVNIDATTDAFDADTLNGAEYTLVMGRPSW